MIVLRFTSGLGNQMFQYSFYRKLRECYGSDNVKADLSWFDWHEEHQGFELEKIFKAEIDRASRGEVLKASGRLPQDFPGAYFVNRIIRAFYEKKREGYIIDEMEPDRQLDMSKIWYLTGYYIFERYYGDRLDEIRDYFVFPGEDEMGLKEMSQRIKESMSVSVHVRRGDYLSPIYQGKFINLDMEYYKKAAELIRAEYPEAVFFVFSDDKDYINKSFDWLDNKVVVSGNTGKDSYKDMYLMSICRHNIIANSTFSTWGALLNKNEGRKVIYPKAYLSGEDSEVKTFDGWIRI